MPIETPSGVLEVENAKLRASSIEATIAVGIGTESNDAYPLQVFKETAPDIRLSEGSTISSASRIYSNNSNLYIQTGSDFTSGSSGDVAFQTMQGASTHMVIKSDGKVGVGTGGPVSILHVKGTGQTSTTSFDTSQTLGASIFAESSDSVVGSGGSLLFGTYQGKFAAIKAGILDGVSNTMGNLHFMTRNATTDATLTNRMTITNTGNVGIGNTNPGAKLDVRSGDIRLHELNSYGSDRYIYTKWEDALNDHQIGLEFDYYSGTGGTGTTHSRLNFVSNATRDVEIYGSGKETMMSVLSNGNVGIGTASPQEALDIRGNINLVGKIESPFFKVFHIFNKQTPASGEWSTSYSGTVYNGSTVVVICNVGGYVSSHGLETWTLQYSTNGSTYTTLDTFKQYFNTTSDHEEQSRTFVWRPTADVNFTNWKITFSANANADDYADLVLIALPI